MPTDIVLSLNRGLMRPLVALINSIVSNSSDVPALRFNIAVPPDPVEIAAFETLIDRSFPDRTFAVRVAGATLSDPIRHYVEGRLQAPLDPASGKALNYARFEIRNLFPDLESFVYLDGDIVVLQDVAEIFKLFDTQKRLAAVRQPLPGIFYFQKPLAGWREGFSIPRPFNAGVYVSHTRYWGEDMLDELSSIMEWDRRHDYKLFWLHTEPLMNLLFKDYQRLPKRWNQSGFGNHPLVARLLKRPIDDIAVLHWSGGHNKPWKNRDTVFAEQWWAYDKGPLPA